MKEKIKRRLRTLFIAYILMGAVSIAGILLLNHHVLNSTEEYMKNGGLDILEDQLEERVNNLVIRIDNYRNSTYDRARMLCSWIASQALNDADYHESLKVWDELFRETGQADFMQIVLCAPEGCTHYSSKGIKNITECTPESIKEYASTDSVYQVISRDNRQLVVFAKYEDLDAVVKDYAYKIIYNADFGSEGYAWIDQIINYDGGDRFAIRLANPNAQDEEGGYLSTNQQDIKGKYLYQEELDSIRETGEMMQRYYFKKYSNNQIVEKVAYGMLYEPYDWVVASGEPVEQIDVMVADALHDAKMSVMYSTTTVVLILFLSGIVFARMGYVSTKKLGITVDDYVFEETQVDTLTKALTRKGGERLLNQDCKSAVAAQKPLLLLILDVDDFKKINDTYGHDVGDKVLKSICDTIKSKIRRTDYIVRWGGEEFVVVCKDVSSETSSIVMEKILLSIQQLEFESCGQKFSVSASIGGAWSDLQDENFEAALKKADQAIYDAKKAGKARFVMSEQGFGAENE